MGLVWLQEIDTDSILSYEFDLQLQGRESLVREKLQKCLGYSMQIQYAVKFHVDTELPNYYARLQTAVARGIGLPAGRLPGPYTDAAPKRSLCNFSSVSE